MGLLIFQRSENFLWAARSSHNSDSFSSSYWSKQNSLSITEGFCTLVAELFHKRLDPVQRAKLGKTRESILDRPADSNFAGTQQAIFSNNFDEMENLLYSSHE